ncbi:Type I phosphodiesterase/nucleotide pyrophosphatase/phosphate transferase [Penicillium alfredii]|uniref:Type I phosphodiesterase/nucleotide pyrophosphatase/phosphate transferase n=1 Tax=Penicillium alfredii TaxID=1506179 RepID=A0A9W9F0A6_9EURO|nr:Type I phosphodiesterase/nucleotide pyrophosphatase/phosphate transferase [Penicillium alfredii]KAJ5091146.1 Type I phosphodiesterase/nucleotide pyrophosphatase/phosphate transferase [Penicillium alfredii]
MRDLSPSLLSPANYDGDAASLRSPSEQDSDSEDDEFLSHERNTLELAEHDRAVLEDEEELEKLLTRRGPAHGLRRMLSPNASSVRIGKREQRRARKEARKARRERVSEEGELMYEMEEGFGDDEISLISRSSSKLNGKEEYIDEPTRFSWRRYLLIFAVILVLFLILILGSYKASTGFRVSRTRSKPLLSNGTALFAPTTILISLDGFRADFLQDRSVTPALNALIADGVSPRYMHPSFPSVTFPNHFTLVTGLYPESHGIVGNNFWDPELEESFYYTHTDVSMQPKWWNAEPLWETAEKQGVKSAIHMWPGSEAHIGEQEPTFLDQYNGTEALSRKVTSILEFLDLPGVEDESQITPERPQFIAAYVPDVDRDGHNYGPNSTEVRNTVHNADGMIAGLMAGLEDRNLTHVVNIVIVSDHGMASTSTDRLVQLEDLVDTSLIEHLDGWPSRGLRPKRPEDLPVLQKQLEKVADKYAHAVQIYTRETMPERYHFTNNDRIAPLWVIPKAGWAIVERPEFDAHKAQKMGEVYHPKGIHGYDHEHPLMRAIFIARGPAFPYTPNSRLEAFQNIEVYNIVCDSLGVDPRPNNGTLHLPLEPVGLHSDDRAPATNQPANLPIHTSTTEGPSVPTISAAAKPTAGDSHKADKTTWWKSFWGKVDVWKQWAGEMFSAEKDNHPGSRR